MNRKLADYSRSRAILVGVSDYSDPAFRRVPAALNSIAGLNSVLTDPELCCWPPEKVTILRNPSNAGRTARDLHELVRDIEDVLLVYYVGHGKLTSRGQLCLAVRDTDATAPSYTGIPYNWVAEALRESPAQVKIVVLDCCFSGQAIETLTALGSDISDLAHISGVYTLTATTRNEPAHVPPLPAQDSLPTSFTGQLLELVKAGLPSGPPLLTLTDIYPHLQQRLAARGLPRPNQRSTNNVSDYPFTRNAAVPRTPRMLGTQLSPNVDQQTVVTTQDLENTRTRREFGALLNRLRLNSGLSLRQLARLCSTSSNPVGVSVVSEWCRGARLPMPGHREQFIRVLETLGVSDPAPWINALVRLRKAPLRGKRTTNPYPGLKSFGADDSSWFFGRDELVAQTFGRLQSVISEGRQPRILWIVGPSGVGKSSILHAGLCPLLNSVGLAVISLTPGSHPVRALADALARHFEVDTAVATERLLSEATEWLATLQERTGSDTVELVIVVDQFEELFTVCRDDTERETFLGILASVAAPAAASGCAVVVGLRIDFYSEVASNRDMVDSLQEAQILVPPMNREQLAAVITEPARQAGFSIEENLVELLLREFAPSRSIDGRQAAGALPLLSYALRQTWDIARNHEISIDDYLTAGGSIDQAVETAAERIFEQLNADDQALARQIFLRLIQMDAGGLSIRAALYTEFEGVDPGLDTGPADRTKDGRLAEITRIIDLFVDARLLIARESTVEIAHEALVEAWPRLRAWIEQDRETLRVQKTITEATRAWIDADRDPSMLAAGGRLAAMQLPDREARPLRLNRDERDFLASSNEQAMRVETAKRRRARRLRVLAGSSAALAVLAGSLAVVASRAQSELESLRDDYEDLRMELDDARESRDRAADDPENLTTSASGPTTTSSAPPASSGAAELDVSPDSVTAGQESVTFTITGGGFAADELIHLQVGPSDSYDDENVDLRSTHADSRGTFQVIETITDGDYALEDPDTVYFVAATGAAVSGSDAGVEVVFPVRVI